MVVTVSVSRMSPCRWVAYSPIRPPLSCPCRRCRNASVVGAGDYVALGSRACGVVSAPDSCRLHRTQKKTSMLLGCGWSTARTSCATTTGVYHRQRFAFICPFRAESSNWVGMACRVFYSVKSHCFGAPSASVRTTLGWTATAGSGDPSRSPVRPRGDWGLACGRPW